MNDVIDSGIDQRVPLVIGVTGHRDLPLEEQPLIRQRVRQFFETLRAENPDLPLRVMTPLAEGADRIAAEVAHDLGIPISVLLPMPRELYQQDFEGDSLDDFNELLLLGEQVELPLLPGIDTLAVRQQGHERDLQYAQLGAYLAAHSHILLAIWDGKPSNAPGGTGHVVRFHQHDIIDLIAAGQHRSPIDFTEDESDLVYHVVCSRQRSGPLEGLKPGEVYWLTRDELKPRTLYMPVRYRNVFERMAEFSEDLKRPMDLSSYYELLPAEQLAACDQGSQEIDDLYHRADFLARRYQRLFLVSLRLTSLFALFAGCSFVLYADIPDQPFMIYPYIVCIAFVLALTWLDRRYSWRRRFQDYRVLAEGLRVQFYWSVAGVVMENPSRFSHDSFLKRQDLELGWIRNVMRYAGRRADSVMHSASAPVVELVVDRWVTDQRDYYSSKAAALVRRTRITGAIGLLSFIVVLVAAVILGFFPVTTDSGNTSTALIALMGLFPFVFAVRQNYALRLAERELVSQYQHNLRIFSNAARLLQETPVVEARQEILRALGEAALEEHGQWILRQRERPATVSESAGMG